MKFYLGVLVSKKNVRNLFLLLNSINKLKKIDGLNLIIVFILDAKISINRNIIKKLINKEKIEILTSFNNNIPKSRNIFLNFLKKKSFKYAGYVDDDCYLNTNWLVNMVKFIRNNNCDVVGGPQKHIVKNPSYKKYFEILEPCRKHKSSVKWVASNNCFFTKKIFKLKNLNFDVKLSNYGGSDQLFFENLSKNNFLIKRNINSYVIENYDVSRENFSWFIKRNLRYGYSGNVIDKKIYNEKAYVVIFIKILILIFLSFYIHFNP